MPWFNDLLDPALIGTEIRCQLCQQLHRLERPHAESSTAAKWHAYVTCSRDGQRYFVGQFADR